MLSEGQVYTGKKNKLYGLEIKHLKMLLARNGHQKVKKQGNGLLDFLVFCWAIPSKLHIFISSYASM